MKTLFLLALDGVLLDSKSNMEFAWNLVRGTFGVNVPFESYFKLIGRPFPAIMDRLDLRDRSQEIEIVFRTASFVDSGFGRFYDGVEAALIRLRQRGARLGIVTSNDKDRTELVLARLPVEFATVQTPNGRYRGKPAPDHLLAAMAETRSDPQDTIYIGHMTVDHLAAIRAGIDYAHASWGYGKPADRCPMLQSIDDLNRFVRVAA